MNTNMTAEEIAKAMAASQVEVDGVRPGRQDSSDLLNFFDGPDPDPTEYALAEEHQRAEYERDEPPQDEQERTDYRPDQPRDEKGRFVEDGGGSGGGSGGGGAFAGKSHEGGTGGDHGGAGASKKSTPTRNEKGHFVSSKGKSGGAHEEHEEEHRADKPEGEKPKDKPEGDHGGGGHGGGGHGPNHISEFIDFLNKPLEGGHGGGGEGGGEGGEGHEKKKTVNGHGTPAGPKPVPAPRHDAVERTDYSPDQPRDDHGRFGEGSVGVDGKKGVSSSSGVGRPGSASHKGESDSKGGGSLKAYAAQSGMSVKELVAKVQERNAAIKAFAAKGEQKLTGEGKHGPIAITPDLNKPGIWRVTQFGADQTPSGHSEHASYHDAVKSAVVDHGYKLPTEESSSKGIAKVADPKEFHAAFEKQMKDSPFKAFVTHYTPEQLAAPDMKTLISKNGTAGVAVHDHGDGRIEGTALWSTGAVKGEGIAMLKEAVANHGVNYCECYAGTLDKFYAGIGFVEESRTPFNKEYASPDWDYERFGTPDYVTMRHPG